MRSSAAGLGLLLGLAVAGGASPAFGAGGVTIDKAAITQTPSLHPKGVQPLDISYADCLSPTQLSIPLTLTAGSGSPVLQVWAGADCQTVAARTSTSQTCKQVMGAKVP